MVLLAGLIGLGVLGCCILGLLGNLLDPAGPASVDPLPALTVRALPVVETPVPVPTETFTSEPVATVIPVTETPLPSPVPPPTVAAVPTSPPDCNCSADTYNCDDALANACFRHCLSLGAGDIHGLDGDGDGIACQGD